MKKLFTFVLAGAMILSMAGCSSSHSESAPPADSSAGSVQQESAADIQDPDLFKSMETVDLEGNQIDTSVFAENKVTLVNVWNVGCTPCIQELGILDALNKEYEGKGAAIRGLYYSFSSEISEEERSEIKEILEAEGAEYPQWQMSQAMLDTDTFQEWSFFPGTFLVDSEGNILDIVGGSRDYEGWKSVIENALEQVDKNA